MEQDKRRKFQSDINSALGEWRGYDEASGEKLRYILGEARRNGIALVLKVLKDASDLKFSKFEVSSLFKLPYKQRISFYKDEGDLWSIQVPPAAGDDDLPTPRIFLSAKNAFLIVEATNGVVSTFSSREVKSITIS